MARSFTTEQRAAEELILMLMLFRVLADLIIVLEVDILVHGDTGTGWCCYFIFNTNTKVKKIMTL